MTVAVAGRAAANDGILRSAWYVQLRGGAFFAFERWEELELDYLRAGVAARAAITAALGAPIELNEVVFPRGEAVTTAAASLRYRVGRGSLGLRLYRPLAGRLDETLVTAFDLHVSTR